ncbi:transcription initiation factor TFIID subunit 8 [Diaphorina citri]|uniref:Transcription initiation factor TFIID subunit 8 n=1 Tax=Diaphorina citri TaxID=121845 RepID=A0A1S3DV51_DIACI|nr:transcription initiation factor TFIID subunit 8 [Diaphorina citri]XP_026676039.1 transcription initiation factor TFIID subunit 8 [Diaphorina citri]KAI5735232.1 hypothetical protein M8J77_015900 [Diaphorina citri]
MATSKDTNRSLLKSSVVALLAEVGFDAADNAALETLVEICQALIKEVGGLSHDFCELANRQQPMLADVLLALIELGIPIHGLDTYAKRPMRTVFPPVAPSTQPKPLSILQAGVKQPHPPHIPPYLPLFPDPHAYIRTPTHKQPVTEYEAIREKAATQKRDLARALNKFIIKTEPIEHIFDEADDRFTLIVPKPEMLPYLCLIPKDQVFEEDEDNIQASPQKKKKPTPVKKKSKKKKVEEDEEDGEEDEAEEEEGEGNEEPEDTSNMVPDSEAIDNPYLRPVKYPQRIKSVK